MSTNVPNSNCKLDVGDISLVDLDICCESFPVTIVPDADMALDIFNKTKDIFKEFQYITEDDESEPTEEDYGSSIAGMIMGTYWHTVSVVYTPEDEKKNIKGSISSGEGCGSDHTVLDRIKDVVVKSNVINNNYVYIDMNRVIGIGVSKTTIGFELCDEADEFDSDLDADEE